MVFSVGRLRVSTGCYGEFLSISDLWGHTLPPLSGYLLLSLRLAINLGTFLTRSGVGCDPLGRAVKPETLNPKHKVSYQMPDNRCRFRQLRFPAVHRTLTAIVLILVIGLGFRVSFRDWDLGKPIVCRGLCIDHGFG